MKPNKLTKKAIQYIKGKTILDLGIGKGRDTIFLAEKGFHVTGIEKSEALLKNVKKICKDKNITLINKPIETFSFDKKYNAIFCLNVLHFIKKENILKIISSIKENTLKDGINVIQVFPSKDNKLTELFYMSIQNHSDKSLCF